MAEKKKPDDEPKSPSPAAQERSRDPRPDDTPAPNAEPTPEATPAQDVARTLRAQMGWILINRDGPAIQPGSRS